MSGKQFTKIYDYTYAMRYMLFIYCPGILTTMLSLGSCESKVVDKEIPEGPEPVEIFPDFITPNEKYFDTRINGLPMMDPELYQLSISGMVDQATYFSLEELRGLDLVKRTLTIESIGNTANGSQIGTAEPTPGLRLALLFRRELKIFSTPLNP